MACYPFESFIKPLSFLTLFFGHFCLYSGKTPLLLYSNSPSNSTVFYLNNHTLHYIVVCLVSQSLLYLQGCHSGTCVRDSRISIIMSPWGLLSSGPAGSSRVGLCVHGATRAASGISNILPFRDHVVIPCFDASTPLRAFRNVPVRYYPAPPRASNRAANTLSDP